MRGEIANKIRAFLIENAGPQTVDSIAIGIGMFGSLYVVRVCGRMKRDGHLIREPGGYVLGKLPPSWEFRARYPTPEARLNLRRERDLKRHRAKRLAAGVKPSPHLQKEAREARAANPPPPKPPKVRNPKPLPDRVFEPAAPTPKQDRLMSSFEWEALGLGKVEVLPGIQVKPLSYGGHRDMNNESMRRSLHE